MIHWQAPRGKYEPIDNWFVRVEGGGIWGEVYSVAIYRETYQGLIIYKRIACDNAEQAKAVKGATSMYGVAK